MLNSMKDFTEQVAAKVRAEMAMQRLSATNISNETGIALKTFSRRLSGKTAWTTDELYAVSQSLRVSVRELLDVPAAKEAHR